jgi:hypothetical protein
MAPQILPVAHTGLSLPILFFVFENQILTCNHQDLLELAGKKKKLAQRSVLCLPVASWLTVGN